MMHTTADIIRLNCLVRSDEQPSDIKMTAFISNISRALSYQISV